MSDTKGLTPRAGTLADLARRLVDDCDLTAVGPLCDCLRDAGRELDARDVLRMFADCVRYSVQRPPESNRDQRRVLAALHHTTPWMPPGVFLTHVRGLLWFDMYHLDECVTLVGQRLEEERLKQAENNARVEAMLAETQRGSSPWVIGSVNPEAIDITGWYNQGDYPSGIITIPGLSDDEPGEG